MSAQPRRMARNAGVALTTVLLTAGCAAGQLAQTSDQKPSLDGNNASVGTMDLRAIAIQAPQNLAASYRAGSDALLNVVFVNNGRSDDRLVGIRTTAATSWAYFRDHNDAYDVQQAALSPSASPSSSESASSSGSDSASSSESGSPSGSDSASSSESASDSPSGTGSTTGSGTESPSASSTPLPTGTKSVTIPVGGRVGFGTPESTGGLLLTGLTGSLDPGDTVRITFTFAKAGTVSVAVPVQLSSLPRTAVVPGGGAEGGG